MIKKMEMDRERLSEVLTLSRIGLPEDQYQDCLLYTSPSPRD